MNRNKSASYSLKFLAVAASALLLPVLPSNTKDASAQQAQQADPAKSSQPAETLPPVAGSTAPTTTPVKKKKMVFTPGVPLTITTASENIRVTNDAKLAREQATNYPDSPEAHFVLAVALTRTSQVEEALKEIRVARKLSTQKGGAAYFDQMISEYEKMLASYPEDNEVRYHLAWAYYMKAYVLARYSKGVFQNAATQNSAAAATENATGTGEEPAPGSSTPGPAVGPNNPAVVAIKSAADNTGGSEKKLEGDQSAVPTAAQLQGSGNWHEEWVKQSASAPVENDTADGDNDPVSTTGTLKEPQSSKPEAPHEVAESSIPSDKKAGSSESQNPLEKAIANMGPVTGMDYAIANAAPQVIPQIKSYYRRALRKLDDVLERDPDDMWAKLYRAHLRLEYTGDIDSAMQTWEACREQNPNSPAPYFFLGEGYLKKGDLRQCLTNVSKAIALRAIGN